MELHTLPPRNMSTTGNRLENQLWEMDHPQGRIGPRRHVAHLEDAAGAGGGDHGGPPFRRDGNLVLPDPGGSRAIADVERTPVPAAKIRPLHLGEGSAHGPAENLPSLPTPAQGAGEMARGGVPEPPRLLSFRGG